MHRYITSAPIAIGTPLGFKCRRCTLTDDDSGMMMKLPQMMDGEGGAETEGVSALQNKGWLSKNKSKWRQIQWTFRFNQTEKKHDQVAVIQTTIQNCFKHIILKNNTTTVFCRAGARLLGPVRAQAGHLVLHYAPSKNRFSRKKQKMKTEKQFILG